jgi:hypothetical protein
MKKVFWILLTLMIAGGAAMWWFARRDNNMYRLVPKDAHIVMSLSIPALASELSPELLGRFNMMDTLRKELLSSGDTAKFDRIRKLRESGSNFGIDFLSDLVYFMTRYEGLDFHGVVFDISDPAEFRKLIDAIDPNQYVDMRANYSVIDLSDGMFLAWNKRGGILIKNDYNYAYARNIIRSNFIVETFNRTEKESILSMEAYQNSKKPEFLFQIYANAMAMDTAKVRVYEDGMEMLQKKDQVGFSLIKDTYMIGGIKHADQSLIFDFRIISWLTGQPLKNAGEARVLSEAHARKLSEVNPIFMLTMGQRDENLDSLFMSETTKKPVEEVMAKMNWTEQDMRSILNAEMSFSFYGISRVPFDPNVDQLPFSRDLVGTDESGKVYMKVPAFNAEFVHSDRALLDRTMEKLCEYDEYFKRYEDHFLCSAFGFNFHVRPTEMGVKIGNYDASLHVNETPNPGPYQDQVLNNVTKYPFYLYTNLNGSTYNADTKDFMEKYSDSMEQASVWLSQFEYLEFKGDYGEVQMVLKFKDGDAKLLDRIIHLMDAIRNPIVS